MDDDETMIEAEIDGLFELTQPIGKAINVLARAELAVAFGELPFDIGGGPDSPR